MINVTKTFLPLQEEFNTILKRAWDQNWITNRGNLVLELEERLKKYLSVPNVLATTNGTLPIQIAIKALQLEGEIITTPFSYVATSSSIVWEGCKPIFVDINSEYLTIDASKIEAAITSKTSAILATHVFGNPCDVDNIERIAHKHNLKVIYDAAHSFGVTYNGKSIFRYGDISTCSFHATKLFHTGEGGALFFNDDTLYNTLYYHHNFGHDGPEQFQGIGINAKMSELQAAMGLSVLPHMEAILNERKRVVSIYQKTLDFSKLKPLKIRDNTSWNYSYYPIIFDSENQLETAILELNKSDIYPRRYFYPSLNTLPYVQSADMPISESISRTVLCLPLFHDLVDAAVIRICEIINTVE